MGFLLSHGLFGVCSLLTSAPPDLPIDKPSFGPLHPHETMTAELIMPQFDPWAGLMLSPALTPVQGVSMTATVPFTQGRQMGVDTSYLLHKG